MSEDLNKYKVLVVEDEVIIAEDIRMTLERLGYEVVGTAESGEEAIKNASLLKPDLVMMDIVLKGSVDGIKASAHIGSNLNIPVVFLTSHSDSATFRRARETGPFGYLMKPYEERDLQATVEMALYKHQMESQLKGKEQWLTIILKSMGDGVIVTDAAGNVDFMNPASEKITGYRARQCVGKPIGHIMNLYMEESHEHIANPSVPVFASEKLKGKSMYVSRGDGVDISIDASAYNIKGEMGVIEGAVYVFRDVTQQRAAQKMLEKSERFLNTIFDSIFDPFCIIDRNYIIVRANEAYARLKSKKLERIIDKKCYKCIAGSDTICKDCVVQRTFAEAKPNNQDRPHTFEDGSEGWVEIFTHPIFDEDGEVSHVIEYTRDITLRKQSDEERKVLISELEFLSNVDPLSGLLNRRALMDFLNGDVDRTRRYGRNLSLILCDIDNFKDVNDSLGHAAGDEAIKAVSDIFREVARKADVVGRYGGDEFMVVMPETSVRGAEDLAERLISLIKAKPLKLTSKAKRKLTLSVGVATFNPEKDSVDGLISRADAALYESKHAGRDRVTVSMQ